MIVNLFLVQKSKLKMKVFITPYIYDGYYIKLSDKDYNKEKSS